jgi:Helix-turn-helix domain
MTFKPLAVGQPFNPYKLFTGIFLPEALVRYRGLSCGAKIAWGRLARYAGENGRCYPSIPTLAREIGVGTTQARSYVHELKAKKFIAIEERPGTSGLSTFLWHEAFTGEVGEKRKIPPLRKTGGVPPRITGGATPTDNRTTTPPENRRQRESGEESHHQESHLKESHLDQDSVLTEQSASLAKEPNTLSGSVIDDDENPNPKLRSSPIEWPEITQINANIRRLSGEMFSSTQMEELQPAERVGGEEIAYASPTDEFLAYVKLRTGQELTFQVLDRIKAHLDSQAVTMSEFLAALKLQNLEAVRSAPAFLTDFAHRFQSATKTVAPEMVKPEDKPRTCELGICGGHGHENLTKGVEITFCKCPVGQELRTKWQRAEERRAAAVASRPSQPEAVPASGREERNRSGAASA